VDLLTDAAESFLAGANLVQMCHEYDFAAWYCTSAKLGSNVAAAFNDLIERAMEVSACRGTGGVIGCSRVHRISMRPNQEEVFGSEARKCP
jgi:hypothetical protein